MKYRFFEDAFGPKGVRIAVEKDKVFPFTYRDVRDEDGKSVFESEMPEHQLDVECGEGFYLGKKLVIISGSTQVTTYFEINDPHEAPYMDLVLSTSLSPALQGKPLLVTIKDYPGLEQIEFEVLREQHIAFKDFNKKKQ